MWLKFFLLFFYFLIGNQSAFAQSVVNIAVIYDEVSDSDFELEYEDNLKDEILQLLQHRYSVNFSSFYGTDKIEDISRIFSEVYSENDFVIAMGLISSNYAISLKTYSKPTICSVVLDPKLQGLTKTESGTSGIKNFTFTESPFDITRDLNLLYQIYPFDHLEVITEEGSIGETTFVDQLFSNYLKGKNVSVDHIFYSSDFNQHFSEMGDHKVAAYALPYLGDDPDRIKNIFQIINKNKVPSAALFGEEYIEAGALCGYETEANLEKIPRRIALTVMKILEGQDAADISVEMESFVENLNINMETARQIGIYPDFDLMSKATFVNLENIQTDNVLNLQMAIGIALQNNLNVKIKRADVDIAIAETSLAKSELLPQIDLATNLLLSDEQSTLSKQGALGRANWTLGGTLSQVIFTEPALANIAIQLNFK